MEIQAEAASVAIDGRTIVDQASITLAPGNLVALVGPSGCGKTTLLNCLGLLQRPTTGRVLVDGNDTSRWSEGQRSRFWREHASFVLQDYGVMEEESVSFNVTMRTRLLGGAAPTGQKGVDAALDRTGLAGRAREPAAHLSGGEKQRLSIARAIFKNAKAVFVDEPTASLDRANRSLVIGLLSEFAHRGSIVVVATHDDEMMAACDLRYVVGQPRTGN